MSLLILGCSAPGSTTVVQQSNRATVRVSSLGLRYRALRLRITRSTRTVLVLHIAVIIYCVSPDLIRAAMLCSEGDSYVMRRTQRRAAALMMLHTLIRELEICIELRKGRLKHAKPTLVIAPLNHPPCGHCPQCQCLVPPTLQQTTAEPITTHDPRRTCRSSCIPIVQDRPPPPL
jgi:hypothetical protein